MKKQRIRALEEQDLAQVIEIWLHVNLAAHSNIFYLPMLSDYSILYIY